ncbi:MAG: PepSY domain-containing protein, partial [Tannerella sp.]|nr:PepSY domain-containing protein [Tannerella sp.]
MLHLWLGLLSATVVFIVCLTGSLYAFRNPFNDFRNRHLINATIPENAGLLHLDEIQDIFHGRGFEIRSIVIPASKKKNLIISYTGKDGNAGGTGYFNPYTCREVTGRYDRSSDRFFQTLLSLHRNLSLGWIGKQIVGISVLIFVFMLVSGLLLWWPQAWKRSTLKTSFLVKWKAKSFRVIYGTHKVFGFYAALLLLFIAITGLYVSYPWMKNAMIVTLGGESILKKEPPAEKEVSDSFASLLQEMLQKEAEKTDTANTVTFSLAKVRAMADKYLDYHAVTTIVMPDENNPRYTVRKINTNNILGAKLNDAVTFDRKGEMRSLERFVDKPLHRQFIEISLPLHTGEIIGLPGIIIYSLISLIGCSLPVTGFIIWW